MAWHPALVRVGETLAGCWRFGSQYRQNFDNEPSNGSKAADRIQEDQGKWPSADDAYSRAFIYLAIGEDHMFSLSKLVNTDEPSFFGYAPLARSAVEAFARAWWILDPGINRSDLLVRGVTERIYNLREEVNTFRKAKQGGVEAKSQLLERIVEECAASGLEVMASGRLPNQFTVNGQKRPTSTTVIEKLMISAGFSEVANVIFNFLSGASKGLWFAQGQQFSVIDPDAKKKWASLQVSLSDIRTSTITTLYAWKDVMGRLIALYGWDEDLWTPWAQRIDRVLVEFKV